MTTKQQIMESYFQKYGVASSVAELSGLLHKRFPNKTTCFKDEAREFIVNRILQHRKSEFHYHADQEIRYTWNPKYIKGTIKDFVRWFGQEHTMSVFQEEFSTAFKDLEYCPAYEV